jgi:hypothetical protein
VNPALRYFLAIVGGLVAGSAINMGLILVSGSVVEPPPGADVTTLEGLRESIHLFQPRHFVFPFLAHALGTLAGAAVAASIAPGHKFRFAMAVGVFFLVGGIVNAAMLPAPLWFVVLDLGAAYIPMAWLGWRLVVGRTTRSPLSSE